LRLVAADLGPALPLFGVAREDGQDRVHAGVEAPGEIVLPEARRHGGCDDHLCERVGQRPFEPVAHLDAHLALARRDQQQGAVVLLPLAQLPVAKEPVSVILDGEAA
jgi:hypothetical protein